MQPIIELKSELEGIIKLEVIKEDGTLKEAEGLNVTFKNLITDAGLDFVSGSEKIRDATTYCRVGTSSKAPTVADTTLGAQTGSASQSGTQTSSVQYTETPYYSQHQTIYNFGVGAVSGNLTEIGFFSTYGTMWSRALIKDSGGNPTTLTLLATEQLRVTYIVKRYLPAPATGSFTLNTNGVNNIINYTITPANITSGDSPWYSSWVGATSGSLWAYETDVLGAVTSRPSGRESNWVTGGAATYVSGTFQRTYTLVLPSSTANFATGIGSIVFWNISASSSPDGAGYQCSFSPKIMKTSSQTLSIGIKISWGRTTQQ